MSKRYLIAQFCHDLRGRWNYQPPFHDLPVSLDRTNEIEPVIGRQYLSEVVNELPQRRRFVRILKSTVEIYQELEPLLLEGAWLRPEHVTGEPWAEIDHLKYGRIKAKFYRPTGGRFVKRSFVEIQFAYGGQQLSFTLENDKDALLGQLEKRVHECVGPPVNLAAAISRQSESRRSRW